ncbi:hypothetical protein [Litorihabitans aurantiacus]|uniref:Uncharacterized protein n=1 Tax=Litorihabitans aurantiacus TaxID=1930061 RepID=A0AA38CT19_9MICO|nr:hypothetical protein [Litorihabitans aurantiacus]GMA32034.1 hypothetical protein GCM10025875_20260 [Litorihabitans aurantiacus]
MTLHLRTLTLTRGRRVLLTVIAVLVAWLAVYGRISAVYPSFGDALSTTGILVSVAATLVAVTWTAGDVGTGLAGTLLAHNGNRDHFARVRVNGTLVIAAAAVAVAVVIALVAGPTPTMDDFRAAPVVVLTAPAYASLGLLVALLVKRALPACLVFLALPLLPTILATITPALAWLRFFSVDWYVTGLLEQTSAAGWFVLPLVTFTAVRLAWTQARRTAL